MPQAARGRPAPQPRTTAAAGGPAAATPAGPAGKGRRLNTTTALADAAAEVEAAEGETARKEAALLRAALRQSAPPAKASKNSNDGKASKNSNDGGDSEEADCEIREPSGRVAQNANAKALAEAARAAADAVKEKERIQGALDKMKAWLKAAEQGSGGRKPQKKHRLSNGERRVKMVRFCGPVTGREKYMMPSCAGTAGALD
jgi:hypothetical protein